MAPVSPACAAPADQAERLVQEGLDLRRAGRDEEALNIFQKAERLGPSPRTRAQAGLAEQALGRWVAAQKSIETALRAKDDPWIIRNRAILESAASSVAEHVGRVMVLGSPVRAKVFINGESAGTLPLSEAFAVAAGEAVVAVEAPGYVSMNRKITVAARRLIRETIDLPPDGSARTVERLVSPPPTTSSRDMTEETQRRAATDLAAPRAEPAANALMGDETVARRGRPGSSQSIDTGWTWQRSLGAGLAALGLGSLVFGIVEHVGRESRASDFRRVGCGTRDLSIGDCQSRYDKVQSAQTWMIVGYVGAAVLGASGAFFLWLSPSEPIAAPDRDAVALAASGIIAHWQRPF